MAIGMLLQRSVDLGLFHLILPVPVFSLPTSQRQTEQMGSEKNQFPSVPYFLPARAAGLKAQCGLPLLNRHFLVIGPVDGTFRTAYHLQVHVPHRAGNREWHLIRTTPTVSSCLSEFGVSFLSSKKSKEPSPTKIVLIILFTHYLKKWIITISKNTINEAIL